MYLHVCGCPEHDLTFFWRMAVCLYVNNFMAEYLWPLYMKN